MRARVTVELAPAVSMRARVTLEPAPAVSMPATRTVRSPSPFLSRCMASTPLELLPFVTIETGSFMVPVTVTVTSLSAVFSFL